MRVRSRRVGVRRSRVVACAGCLRGAVGGVVKKRFSQKVSTPLSVLQSTRYMYRHGGRALQTIGAAELTSRSRSRPRPSHRLEEALYKILHARCNMSATCGCMPPRPARMMLHARSTHATCRCRITRSSIRPLSLSLVHVSRGIRQRMPPYTCRAFAGSTLRLWQSS